MHIKIPETKAGFFFPLLQTNYGLEKNLQNWIFVQNTTECLIPLQDGFFSFKKSFLLKTAKFLNGQN